MQTDSYCLMSPSKLRLIHHTGHPVAFSQRSLIHTNQTQCEATNIILVLPVVCKGGEMPLSEIEARPFRPDWASKTTICSL